MPSDQGEGSGRGAGGQEVCRRKKKKEKREKVGTTSRVRRSWESRFAGKGASRTRRRFFWIGTRICLSHG